MKPCNSECLPVCDFCYHCEKEYEDYDGQKIPTGDGLCKLHNKIIDICGYCEDFDCFRNHKE